MRRYRSVSSTRLPPRPSPHPTPCHVLCLQPWFARGALAFRQLAPAARLQPHCFLAPQLVPQGLDLSRGRKQLSRCLDSVRIALAGPFLPPLRPLCHNTSTALTLLPGHPPPGQLLQAEAVTTVLGIPRNQARCIISAQ